MAIQDNLSTAEAERINSRFAKIADDADAATDDAAPTEDSIATFPGFASVGVTPRDIDGVPYEDVPDSDA